MAYRTEAEKASEKLMGYYKDTDWTVSKVSREISLEHFEKEITVSYKKSAEFDGHIYKAEGILDGKPDEIIKYVIPSPLGVRDNWDKTIKTSEILDSSEEEFFVVYSQTHSSAMGLISSRDFVDAVLIKHIEDDGIICTNSVSVDYSARPPVDDVVRAFNHPGGTFCVAVEGDEDKTKVISFLQSDLKGMLPRTLVETALPNTMIDFFIGLKTAMEKNVLHAPADTKS